MKELASDIIIASSPREVWEVLTDFDSYRDWNPFIRSVEGLPAEGETLTVSIQPPGSRSMTFRPVVLKAEATSEFRWKGKLLVRGLFDGEHYFILRENEDRSTTFIQGEIFSGILTALFSGILEKTERGFGLMNEALRSECER
ncbi:MAG: SRPBCC domain-containing protein [Candidatus Latescibacteria bacterium]|nr:SRPBCC domain-containing protein [bacterium]MBD3422962.1 SRPBCC domain-containing protein [Candidatus Latescibacterota bacterium]